MRRCHVSTEVRNVRRLLALILLCLSEIRARRRLTLKTVYKLALPQPSTNYLKKFFFIAEPDSTKLCGHSPPLTHHPHSSPHPSPSSLPHPTITFLQKGKRLKFVAEPSSMSLCWVPFLPTPPHPWLLAGRNVYIKKVASSCCEKKYLLIQQLQQSVCSVFVCIKVSSLDTLKYESINNFALIYNILHLKLCSRSPTVN